jgi:hypothetical protein
MTKCGVVPKNTAVEGHLTEYVGNRGEDCRYNAPRLKKPRGKHLCSFSIGDLWFR